MAVLDASFLVKLIINESCTKSALRELRSMAARAEKLHIPCIALAEVLNAVWRHTRLTRELSPEEARRAMQRLKRLQQVLVLHNVDEFADEALDEALNYGITFYDALYVALAERTGNTLYTYDARLAEKLKDMKPEVKIIVPNC